MLLANMKCIIKYVIELDIDYIESFLGYDGDKILEFMTKKKEVFNLNRSLCQKFRIGL
jgi:hypothetical protein